MSNLHEVKFGPRKDIPTQLRDIAKMLEDGEFGEVTGGVIILNTPYCDVFGLGRGDLHESYFLMGVAQQKFAGRVARESDQ